MSSCPFIRVFAWISLIASVAGCSGPSSPYAHGTDIVFESADGIQLAGTLYLAAAERPPSLILLHMLGSTRASWVSFASQARSAGYTCLAFDLRGHGESRTKGGEQITYRGFDQDDWLAAAADIDAAKARLLQQGVHPDNILLAGASIGASLALIYAAQHPDIQGVVMLSPGLEYRGIVIEHLVKDFRKRPLLFVTSEGDRYSASSAEQLKSVAPGHCELRTYAGSAHGTDLLASVRNATTQILQWADMVVGKNAGGGATGLP